MEVSIAITLHVHDLFQYVYLEIRDLNPKLKYLMFLVRKYNTSQIYVIEKKTLGPIKDFRSLHNDCFYGGPVTSRWRNDICISMIYIEYLRMSDGNLSNEPKEIMSD